MCGRAYRQEITRIRPQPPPSKSTSSRSEHLPESMCVVSLSLQLVRGRIVLAFSTKQKSGKQAEGGVELMCVCVCVRGANKRVFQPHSAAVDRHELTDRPPTSRADDGEGDTKVGKETFSPYRLPPLPTTQRLRLRSKRPLRECIS